MAETAAAPAFHTAKAEGCVCPFLEQFVEELCSPPAANREPQLVAVASLFEAYTHFVRIKTSDLTVLACASEKRFGRQFAALARRQGYEKVQWHDRGYLLMLRRLPRSPPPAATTYLRVATAFLDAPTEEELHVHVLPVPLKGDGLFAKCPLPAGKAVCEYEGEEVTEHVYRQREIIYIQQEKVQKCIEFPETHTALDGYRRRNGEQFAKEEEKTNLGSMMNHSKKNPNCVPIRTMSQRRVVMVTTRAIAAGQELSWDYAPEDGCGMEEWFRTT
jgi:hypothetical protein